MKPGARHPRAAPPDGVHWHRVGRSQALERLGTDADRGLDAAEAGERLRRHGPNELDVAPARSPWLMLAGQLTDFMILVLLAAAVVAGLVGEPQDSVAIVVIVVLNALVGFAQEYRAERTMAALRRLATPRVRALRGGRPVEIASVDLVPGDVVLLEAGNLVPADLRLIEAAQLRVQESALTGESHAVEKQVGRLEAEDVALGDRTNMAYKGTLVVHGRGRGVVAGTGMATELGRIAELLRGATGGLTPLQRRLAQFGRRLALGALGICAIVFAAGLLRGESVALMFLTAVSLAVAAIPEALPAVVTVALALGAGKMATRHALVRRLPAVESLGSVTVICTDKTGTLTQNRMRVESVWAGGGRHERASPWPAGEPWDRLAVALAISNDASIGEDGAEQGDPTETALLSHVRGAGFHKAALERLHPRAHELPFDAERKRMTTVHRHGPSVLAITKGAPESVIRRCEFIAMPEGEVPIDAAAVLRESEHLAAEGLRVLAIASRHWEAWPEPASADQAERALVLLGLVGLADPPREEARAAVAECLAAGIRPVMITGDHPATAGAIARRLGILGEGEPVMDGPRLARLDAGAREASAALTSVYARVSPEQKIRIVEALQGRGEIVAMTGDGVNDAPALKQADVGVAMGRSGTDVAREASSLVLMDDNFATIVAAVREGRRIYDNIRKFIRYAVTGNLGEIWTIFLAPFLGMPIPLLPIHILWINLATDGLPGLALALEPAERGLMARPPRPPGESVFARGLWQHMAWVGLLMGGVCIATQAWAIADGNAHGQTMVFTVLALSQLGHVLAIRSERDSLFAPGLAPNRALAVAVAATFLLQLAVIYVPALNGVFHTQPLAAVELALCLALSSVVFLAVEAEKALVRRGWLYRERTRR